MFESGSSTRQRIDEWLVDNGEHAAPVMELGSIEAIKRMVRAGLGYSIVPDVAVQTEEDSLGLRVTPLQPPLQRTLALVMRQGQSGDERNDGSAQQFKKGGYNTRP